MVRVEDIVARENHLDGISVEVPDVDPPDEDNDQLAGGGRRCRIKPVTQPNRVAVTQERITSVSGIRKKS